MPSNLAPSGWRTIGFVAVTIALLSVFGCGRGGPKTHPVRGKVEVTNGDVKVLAGSFVEAALVTDPTVRSSGIIKSDGSFNLETLHEGSGRSGAIAGKYHVRLVIADEDRHLQQQAERSIAPRFLDWKASGLIIEVPTATPVTLEVAPQ